DLADQANRQPGSLGNGLQGKTLDLAPLPQLLANAFGQTPCDIALAASLGCLRVAGIVGCGVPFGACFSGCSHVDLSLSPSCWAVPGRSRGRRQGVTA